MGGGEGAGGDTAFSYTAFTCSSGEGENLIVESVLLSYQTCQKPCGIILRDDNAMTFVHV